MTSPRTSRPLPPAKLTWLSNRAECTPSIEIHESPDGWLQAPGCYPRLVIRVYSTVYSRVQIDLQCAEPAEATIAGSAHRFSTPASIQKPERSTPLPGSFLLTPCSPPFDAPASVCAWCLANGTSSTSRRTAA